MNESVHHVFFFCHLLYRLRSIALYMLSDIILQDNSSYFQIGTNWCIDNFSELKQSDY